jgi:hypothetical protein
MSSQLRSSAGEEFVLHLHDHHKVKVEVVDVVAVVVVVVLNHHDNQQPSSEANAPNCQAAFSIAETASKLTRS